MSNPVSRFFLVLLIFVAGVLIGMFALRSFDWSVIPADWRQNTDSGAGVVDNSDGEGEPLDDVQETSSASGNIVVTSPHADDTIGLPLVVTGRARVFENTFSYRLLDSDETTVLVEGFGTADAPDVGQFGDFIITTSYSLPTGSTGTLEVFAHSAKDGSVIDLARVPVKFSAIETMVIKTYWTSSANTTDCSQVVASERRIAKTVATAHAALSELLAGPNAAEQAKGYKTAIPDDVTIKSITIKDGVVDVELSKEIDVGGSCRMAAIRAQIETTLKQFPTVTSVGLRVDGKSEGESLQP
ncbi:MAG: Gmad2 immunoglobulin-like domain-containing protein [Patescibacteria group bacterium]